MGVRIPILYGATTATYVPYFGGGVGDYQVRGRSPRSREYIPCPRTRIAHDQ